MSPESSQIKRCSENKAFLENCKTDQRATILWEQNFMGELQICVALLMDGRLLVFTHTSLSGTGVLGLIQKLLLHVRFGVPASRQLTCFMMKENTLQKLWTLSAPGRLHTLAF